MLLLKTVLDPLTILEWGRFLCTEKELEADWIAFSKMLKEIHWKSIFDADYSVI